MMAKKRDMEQIDIPKQKTPKRELPKVDRYIELLNELAIDSLSIRIRQEVKELKS